ncbi:hypothetical protein IGI04_001957, partial [Brassica rapa subsp. trilocularis]
YEDIFTNTLFINDQKTILSLTLSLSRDPLFFLSLSRSFFFLVPPIHRRSTISLSRSFFFLSASDSPEIHHLSLIPPVLCVPEKLCSILYESHNPASTHLL